MIFPSLKLTETFIKRSPVVRTVAVQSSHPVSVGYEDRTSATSGALKETVFSRDQTLIFWE